MREAAALATLAARGGLRSETARLAGEKPTAATRRRAASSLLGALDAELLDAAVERRAAETEQLGRFADVTAGVA
jgi:hypothetical protein